jgi:hypothetical protein
VHAKNGGTHPVSSTSDSKSGGNVFNSRIDSGYEVGDQRSPIVAGLQHTENVFQVGSVKVLEVLQSPAAPRDAAEDRPLAGLYLLEPVER